MDNLNTLFIGRVLKEFSKLASTNKYAQELTSKNKPNEGTVISTLDQHDGRGQIGSSWESEPHKNIALSVILYPHFLPIKNQFQLNQAISLGVFDFVSQQLSNKNIKIKWSNDIYVGRNKICGILIQNSLSNYKIQSSIIGIGINVNQTQFITNPPNPTSFQLETGEFYDLTYLKNELFNCLERRYFQLKNGNIGTLQKDYLANLYQYQIPAQYKKATGQVFGGTIIGLSKIGKLQIEKLTGQVEEFAIKEVQFL